MYQNLKIITMEKYTIIEGRIRKLKAYIQTQLSYKKTHRNKQGIQNARDAIRRLKEWQPAVEEKIHVNRLRRTVSDIHASMERARNAAMFAVGGLTGLTAATANMGESLLTDLAYHKQTPKESVLAFNLRQHFLKIDNRITHIEKFLGIK